MPLNKSLFEKNIAGNASFSGNSSSSSIGGGTDPPRRKWGKAASTASPATTTASPSKPKWGGSALKKASSTGVNNNSNGSSSSNGISKFGLKKTPPASEKSGATASAGFKLKPTPTKSNESSSSQTEPAAQAQHEEPSKPTMAATHNNSHSDSSTVTASTADITESSSSMEKFEASADLNLLVEEGLMDSASDLELEASSTTAKIKTKTKSKSNKKGDKSKKSGKSAKKKKEGSPFALAEGDYLKEVPPEQRTTGKFDWSGVDSVLASIIYDKKTAKKADKLKEKLDNINATREDALKMMKDHVQEQKDKLDDKKREISKRAQAASGGMTYEEMVDKVKEQQDIVTTLKKSNNKLRTETDKMHGQVRNLRVNNMKLEEANKQSEAVLEQLKERKKSLDARYEQLTKKIIPPHQQRVKEFQDCVDERKAHGRLEHRTKLLYANCIIRFLDKVDRSEESNPFKSKIWEMGQHVQGGEYDDSDSDDDDDVKIEMPPPPENLNESISINLGAELAADDGGKQSASSSSLNDSKSVAGTEKKSLWDRYGSGDKSKSAGMNDSNGKLEASSSSLTGGKNADILQKANRAKAGANFNGAVILSDSDSDDDSDSGDSDDDASSSSDDS